MNVVTRDSYHGMNVVTRDSYHGMNVVTREVLVFIVVGKL